MTSIVLDPPRNLSSPLTHATNTPIWLGPVQPAWTSQVQRASSSRQRKPWLERYGQVWRDDIMRPRPGRGRRCRRIYRPQRRKVIRAPRRMNILSMERCFRLIQEPRRLWYRYIVGNLLFPLRAWRDPSPLEFRPHGKHRAGPGCHEHADRIWLRGPDARAFRSQASAPAR